MRFETARRESTAAQHAGRQELRPLRPIAGQQILSIISRRWQGPGRTQGIDRCKRRVPRPAWLHTAAPSIKTRTLGCQVLLRAHCCRDAPADRRSAQPSSGPACPARPLADVLCALQATKTALTGLVKGTQVCGLGRGRRAAGPGQLQGQRRLKPSPRNLQVPLQAGRTRAATGDQTTAAGGRCQVGG